MQPKDTRGYLHYSTATDATSLDQMNQLRDGSAYLILHMKRVAEEYKVLRNTKGTITLKTKQTNEIVRVIGRHYLQFCLNRRGQPIKTACTDLSNWAPILGDEPPIELTHFFT